MTARRDRLTLGRVARATVDASRPGSLTLLVLRWAGMRPDLADTINNWPPLVAERRRT
jgi:hypothetical protein